MSGDNPRKNKPVREQGPRLKAGVNGSPSKEDRQRETGGSGATGLADATGLAGAAGTTGATKETKDSSTPWGTIVGVVGASLVALVAVAGFIRANGDDEAVAAEGLSSSSSETTATAPIDYDAAETTAFLYCDDAPLFDYEEDWDVVSDYCTDLVLKEIRRDEQRFRDASGYGASGYIDSDAIEEVLGDPESFLEEHGYTTTTETTTRTTTRTVTPEPTYEEPEPTYEAPSSGSSGPDRGSAGIGGGGRPLAWQTVGPFGGLQGCEDSASNQPLYASECYVGSDNLYYYDAKVQAPN